MFHCAFPRSLAFLAQICSNQLPLESLIIYLRHQGTTATTRLTGGVDLGLYISTGIELQDDPVAEHILHMNTLDTWYISAIRGIQDVKEIQQRTMPVLMPLCLYTCTSQDVMDCPGMSGDGTCPPLMPKRSPTAARRTRGGLSATRRFLRSLGENAGLLLWGWFLSDRFGVLARDFWWLLWGSVLTLHLARNFQHQNELWKWDGDEFVSWESGRSNKVGN